MATRLAPDPGKARRHSSSVVHRTADAGRVGGITLFWLLFSESNLPVILTQILVLEQACPSAPASLHLSPKSPRQWASIDLLTYIFVKDNKQKPSYVGRHRYMGRTYIHHGYMHHEVKQDLRATS